MAWKPSFTELIKAIALLCWLGLCVTVLLVWGVGALGEAWLSRVSITLALLIIALWPTHSKRLSEEHSAMPALMRELIEEKDKRLRKKDERIRSLGKEKEQLQKELKKRR